MSDLAVDFEDDLLLVEGRAQLARGAVATRQAWITHLTLFLGEWFRDQSLGIDYQNLILDKKPSNTVLRAIFARASRETPGVKEVSDLRFALDARTRVLTVTAEVVHDTGEAGTLTTSTAIGGG
jgi:hypothetical protein